MTSNMAEKRTVDCIYDNENWLITMPPATPIVMNAWDIFAHKSPKFAFAGKVDLSHFIYHYR